MLKSFKHCLSLIYLGDYLLVSLLLGGSEILLKIWVILVAYGGVEG